MAGAVVHVIIGVRTVHHGLEALLRRKFDQLAEDVSMQELGLTLLIDRAGLVGDDGITHHGIFDVSLLNKIPNTLIYSPDSLEELAVCMDKCLSYGGLSAVRYPKGGEQDYDRSPFVNLGTVSYADYGVPSKVIMTYGRLTGEAVKADVKCQNVRVIKLIQIKPVDFKTLIPLVGDMQVLFAEEGLKQGGIGETFACETGKRTVIKAIDTTLPEHGSNALLLKKLKLDADSLASECAGL